MKVATGLDDREPLLQLRFCTQAVIVLRFLDVAIGIQTLVSHEIRGAELPTPLGVLAGVPGAGVGQPLLEGNAVLHLILKACDVGQNDTGRVCNLHHVRLPRVVH